MSEKLLHAPIMVQEILEYLCRDARGLYVDATLGMGGHTRAILSRFEQARVIALDQDAASMAKAKELLGLLGERVRFVQSNFRLIDQAVKELGINRVDGILFDLGISSFQLDDPKRGFTFQQEGPLDMRMDQGVSTSAFELIARLSEPELAKILEEYGDERYAKRIARTIVYHRGNGAIDSTIKLSDVVLKAMPSGRNWQRIHPATRTFQALRIAVNDELGALQEALSKAFDLLTIGGRMCVLSFHSLEDRIVKHQFKDFEKSGRAKVITKKPLDPTEDEIERNPRSRSAHLRVVERINE